MSDCVTSKDGLSQQMNVREVRDCEGFSSATNLVAVPRKAESSALLFEFESEEGVLPPAAAAIFAAADVSIFRRQTPPSRSRDARVCLLPMRGNDSSRIWSS